MLEIILPSVIAGGMVKFVDIVVDEEVRIGTKLKHRLQRLLPFLGFISSLMFLYLSRISTGLSTLWMSVAIACLLAGKIDSPPHRISFAIYLLGFFLLNLRIDTLLTLLLLPFAFMDEIGSSLFNSRGVRNNPLRNFFRYRLSLETFVFLFSLFSKKIEIWVSLLFFDLSYNMVLLIARWIKKLLG